MEEQLDTLQEQAEVIRDETTANENTATRVGQVLINIIQWLRDFFADVANNISNMRTSIGTASTTADEAKLTAETARSKAESALVKVEANTPVICTQAEYDAKRTLGEIDMTKTYFIKEEQS